ncbi:MFS transporter [Methylobacterium brachythecii]|uniref:MFS transporter n=2 Tax=Methylobacterium brachythecii TaxID=1176177 RepID=A0ABQ6D1S1_9HYPH|nr:MFS transporter [Methylobacterium brachythecii]GLS44279.1 MFS transporter [Methylobacterium brachythecii]
MSMPETTHEKVALPAIRWVMILLCFLILGISYVDRINLAIAAPHIKKELGFNDGEMGLILGAFFWTYAFGQLPAGWFTDRIGAKIGLALSAAWWSIFTVVTGFANSVATMFGSRMMLGIGEAGSNPACVKVVYGWFPKRERGLASGLFDAGPQAGTAIALPLVAWLIHTWDWRVSFYVTGALGLVWVLFWLLIYREPENDRSITPQQLAALREGVETDQAPAAHVPWSSLFKYRTMWGMMIGFFCMNFVKYFFITWFPTYLVSAKGFSLGQLGTLGAIPALMSLPGSVLGGWMTDHLFHRGFSLTASRKICLAGGMLTSSVIAFAAFTDSIALMLILFSITYAALAFTAAVIWCVPADVAPSKAHVASIGGIQNFASNLAGVGITSVTGLMLWLSGGSFLGPLLLAGGVCILGALNYIFVVGTIEPFGGAPKAAPQADRALPAASPTTA